MEKIYILILNWNGWKDTVECLESVCRIDYPDYQVVVCDNGSSDNSIEHIKAWADGKSGAPAVHKGRPLYKLSNPPVLKPLSYTEYSRTQTENNCKAANKDSRLVLIRTGANLGFAGGNNVGIRYAISNGADYVWLLNNDTVVAPDALTALVKTAESSSEIGITGSKIYHYNDPRRLWYAGGFWRNTLWRPTHRGANRVDSPEFSEIREVDYASGCSLLIKAQTIRAIGLMQEEFFLYWEETDWNATALEKGWRVVYSPASKVWHKISASVKDDRFVTNYYMRRNSLLFYQRHSPFRLFILFPWLVLLMFAYFLTGRQDIAKGFYRGILDFLSRSFGPLRDTIHV